MRSDPTTKLLVWALAATVAALALLWAYNDARQELRGIARDLYATCRALERTAPALLQERSSPTDPAGYTQEYERWLRNERRIIEACEAHAEWFGRFDERAKKRRAGAEKESDRAGR